MHDQQADRQAAAIRRRYGVDRNATQAALRAGHSARSAYSIGQENLKKPEVHALVDSLEEERAERTRVTADKVVRELARLALSDMRSYVKWGKDGLAIKPFDELSPTVPRPSPIPSSCPGGTTRRSR